MGSSDLVFNAQLPQCICALLLGVQQGDLAQSVDRLDRLQIRESTRQACDQSSFPLHRAHPLSPSELQLTDFLHDNDDAFSTFNIDSIINGINVNKGMPVDTRHFGINLDINKLISSVLARQ